MLGPSFIKLISVNFPSDLIPKVQTLFRPFWGKAFEFNWSQNKVGHLYKPNKGHRQGSLEKQLETYDLKFQPSKK